MNPGSDADGDGEPAGDAPLPAVGAPGEAAADGEAAAAGLLEVSEGATVKVSGYAKDTVPLVILLPKPYKAAVNTAVSASLAAGGAGAVGTVNLIGFTI